MQQNFFKKNAHKLSKLFFLISLLSIITIGKFYFDLSITNFVLFLIYLSLYIYLPGKIIYKILNIKNFINRIEDVLAFFLGMFFIIIQYYIFSFFDSLYLIKYFTPVLLIIRMVYLKKKNKLVFFNKTDEKIDSITYLFMGVNIFISAIFSLFAFPKPTVVSNALTYQDTAWHMGNVNILSSGNSMDSRVYGVKFLYHYFSDLFYAIAKYIFGFSSYELVIQFQFVLIGTLVTISLIGFFKTVFKGNNSLAYLTTFFFLYAPTVADGYFNSIFYHIFTNVNAMALTLPVVLVVLLIIKDSLEFKSSGLNILLISIFMFLLAGLKGPIALLLLVTLFVLSFVLLIQKKINTTWVFFLLMATFSYTVIHVTLLSQGSDLVEISMDTAFDVITTSSSFPGGLKIQNNSFLTKFTYVISHFMLVVFFFSIPFIYSLVRNVYKLLTKQNIYLFNQFCLIFSILSLGAYYIIRHSGYSQMYFLFGVLPIIYYLGGNEIANLVERYTEKDTEKEFKILFLITISLFSLRPILETVNTVSEKIEINYSNFTNEQVDYFNSSISYSEYEGMMWLKKHTNKDDLLATNRHNEGNLFFLYSAYSDRNFYIEGSDYAKNSGLNPEIAQEMLTKNDLLFSPDYQNKYNLAMELNVDYLVQFKKIQPTESYTKEKKFQLCFENKDISIYKVRR